MTNTSVLESKISSIQKYLKILAGYQNYSQQQLEDDLHLKGSVERYLYLLTQSVLDLAEAIISFKDFRRPQTYSEFFDILQEEKLISKDLTEKLVKMAKFRNIISHDYENLDFGIIYDVLQNRLQDVEEFLKQIKNKLNF